MLATSNSWRCFFQGIMLLTFSLGCFCGCTARSSQPSQPGTETAVPMASARGVSLYLLDDTRLGPPRAERFMLDATPTAGGLELTVRVIGAQRLRSCYLRLEYDADEYAALSAEPGLLWGAADRRLSLAVLDRPGEAYLGVVLIHPQDQWGFDGDGVVACLALGRPGAAAWRSTAAAPVISDASKALLNWDAGTSTLSWYYSIQGDYDQNGEVAISDLTPLGIHFSEVGPWDISQVQSQIDGDSNGEINIGDVTPIGVNFQTDSQQGYALYASNNLADYPSTNGELPALPGFGGSPLNSAVGNTAVDRLYFEFIVAAPQPNDYYWVRPFSSTGENGTPSTMVGGNPADVPVISFVAPPALGSGTAADPYQIASDESYALNVTSPSMGDVTTDPSTVYLVSDPRAGTIATSAAALQPTFPYTGDFAVWAAYDNVSTANRLYVQVPEHYTWSLETVDNGGPADDDVGFYASAANIGNQPAIAYYNSTAQNLKYAQYDSGVWHSMTVESAGNVGQSPSLMQFNGKPAIAYWDAETHALKLARATVSNPEQVSDWSIHAVETPVEASQISLALIGGRLAIAYHNFGSGRVDYARALADLPSSAADWQVHQIEATEMCDTPRLHSVNAAPGLAFRAVESKKLIYARSAGTEPSSTADWIMMEVAPAEVSSLSFDDLEGLVPMLIYRDHATDTLNIALSTIDPTDFTDWHVEQISGGHGEGGDCSVATIHGMICLAYERLQSTTLLFAASDDPAPVAGDWQHQDVDTNPDVGGFCSLIGVGDPSSALPGIAYYDGANHELKFARGAES